METVVLKMLFIASVSAYGKHVYVEKLYSWPDAQRYCRDHHTDLSPMTQPWVEERLVIAMGNRSEKLWIGLYRDGKQWKWSGGGNASAIPWAMGQPNNMEVEQTVAVCWKGCGWDGWHNMGPSAERSFFCFNLIVVDTGKSWQEALEHCRQTHKDLTSLVSETENLLALSEMKPLKIVRVWIGLRYLGDRWLWVNGDPLEYEAWGGVQDHQCPILKRCGALTKGGQWENRDCQEKLNFICY